MAAVIPAVRNKEVNMFNRRLLISEAGGAGGLSVTINVKSGGFIPSNISGAKVYVEGGH